MSSSQRAMWRARIGAEGFNKSFSCVLVDRTDGIVQGKMFACTKRFSMKVKEKVEFRLEFYATQVPAWDKLLVALIPLDTGRISARTRKAFVQNGRCHWPDAVIETSKLLLDIRTLLFDEKFYKFVVGKGLSRSNMLGEVILNLAEYVTSPSPTSVALPLRFCFSGTILHVTIQCLTPKNPNPSMWQQPRYKFEEFNSDGESNSTPYRGTPSRKMSRGQVSTSVDPMHDMERVQSCLKKSGSGCTNEFSSSETLPCFRGIDEDTLLVHGSYVEAMQMQAAVVAERDRLKAELEHVKIASHDDNDEHQAIVLRLSEELALERQANSRLTMQLHKLRHSNMELLLAVRDLEGSSTEQKQSLYTVIREGEAPDKPLGTIGDIDVNPSVCQLLLGDLENVKVVLHELFKHPGAASVLTEARASLQALLQASQAFILQDHEARNSEAWFARIKRGIQEFATADEITTAAKDRLVFMVDELAALWDLNERNSSRKDDQILQLEMRKKELEVRVASFCTEEEARSRKMDQLHQQVWEFSREVEYMQASNARLEALLATMEEEKQQLHSRITEEDRSGTSSSEDKVSTRMLELEAQLKSLEDERDAYLLERRVFESLAKDLSEQVQKAATKSAPEQEPGSENQSGPSEAKVDIIYHLKELRAAFWAMMKVREEFEDRFCRTETRCDSLVKQHGQLVTTIASLDREFGQLSRQSDQLLQALNEEVEDLLSKCQHQQQDRMMRLALEENACEIAYLRDEVQRLKQHNTALVHKGSEMAETAKRFEAELASTTAEYNAKLEALTLEHDARQVLVDECIDVAKQEEDGKAQDEAEHGESALSSFLDQNSSELNLNILEDELEDHKKETAVKLTFLAYQLDSSKQEGREQLVELEAALEQCKGLTSALLEKTKVQEESLSSLRRENQNLRNCLFQCDTKCSDLEKKTLNIVQQEGYLETRLNIMEHGLESICAAVSEQVLAGSLQIDVICMQLTQEHGRLLEAPQEQAEEAEILLKQEGCTGISSAKRVRRRRWNQQQAQEADQCSPRLLDACREREAVLCEKIVRLESCRRVQEDVMDELKNANAKLETDLAALQDSIARKEAELQERESLLWKKIEYLEVANEQLASQQLDPGVEQLKTELTRLQAQIAESTRRERELTTKLGTHELLQLELLRLQEENEHLQKQLLKLKESSMWGDMLERMVYLETELAEALETNNMYKLQLQSALAKQDDEEGAAGVEGIIESLVSFKKQTSFLEAELKEMQDRYLSMSMRFAEIQGEREELIMMLRTLRASPSTEAAKRGSR